MPPLGRPTAVTTSTSPAAPSTHTRLGTQDAAEPLLRRAPAGYDHSRTRETALYQTWLAKGHARARQPQSREPGIAAARDGVEWMLALASDGTAQPCGRTHMPRSARQVTGLVCT
ncbi:hypothetical protein GCM10010169_48850 [Micromonospora fulviviridis]|nr:hypothetical protein GCM10010169_48850 [Micromonospora fulviviridis]